MKSKEEDWEDEPGTVFTPINVNLMTRYYNLCETLHNKFGGQAVLNSAKNNGGVLESSYRVKYGCGRRHAKAPSPAKVDGGSRAVAMYGSSCLDGDQINSAIAILLFFGIVLAVDE